jgi:hypothetical protein
MAVGAALARPAGTLNPRSAAQADGFFRVMMATSQSVSVVLVQMQIEERVPGHERIVGLGTPGHDWFEPKCSALGLAVPLTVQVEWVNCSRHDMITCGS